MNVFDGVIHKLELAKEIISETKERLIETSQIQRGKMKEKQKQQNIQKLRDNCKSLAYT